MNIVISKGNAQYYLLTNKDLKVGDKVFPMTHGYTQGKTYYVFEVDTSLACSGWPSEPHTILDLHHSDDKGYEIRTDKGYGPREKYFKLIDTP